MPFGFTRSILGASPAAAPIPPLIGELSGVLDTRSGQYSTTAYELVNLSTAFTPYVGEYGRLVFQYISGSSFTGDIQLDDINIGSSNNYSFEADGQDWETTNDNTTTSTDTNAYYQGLTWLPVSTGTTINKWNRHTGSTSSFNTGLPFAYQGSYYLYVETTNPGYASKVTWLRSPPVTLDTATLNYALGRYGATIGTIKVFWESLPLYVFTSHIFTTAGLTGRDGPTLAQCTAAYSAAYWASNTAYFNVSTQGVQEWTVPENGTYRIKAEGASGWGSFGTKPPGASIQGDFTLTQGEIIKIVVGQRGVDDSIYDASGGGGSFVIKSPYNTAGSILVIAGGGGGRNISSTSYPYNLSQAQGQSGQAGGTAAGGSPGSLGYGGTNNNQTTMGGAGFFGDAIDGATGSNKIMAKSFLNGSVGGQANFTSAIGRGGFGGGGASGRGANYGPAGGGGGYTGGAAGYNSRNGGGGGSRNGGANPVNVQGGSGGNSYTPMGSGQVTITKL
jgi:hypothetical protein